MSEARPAPTVAGGRPGAGQLDAALPADAKEALKHLELFARRIVDGMLHGIHRSPRIGVSTDFDHHKNYTLGDPLKHVDWKISARHEKLYVKRYLEETAMTVRLVIDRSASMRQATEDLPSKYDLACRSAAALAYLILKQGDAVGLTLASAQRTEWLPARSTQQHLVRMLESMLARPAESPDQLEGVLQDVLERETKRGMVVVVSDLMFEPDLVQRKLAALQARGHEVLLCQVQDPTEATFPFNRWVEFRDLEDPATRRRLDTVPLKKLYLEEFEALQEEWASWARKFGVHRVVVAGTDRVSQVLSEYLRVRRMG